MPPGSRTALLILLYGLTSCGTASAPEPAELAGTWTATKAEYVSKTSSASIDIIAAGGSATLELTAEGRYEYVEIPAGEAPETTRGGWSASADTMTCTIDGLSGERQYDLDFSENTLRLTGADVLYDLGSGYEEAKQNLAFTR